MDRKSSAWAITPLAKPLQSSDISKRDLSTSKGTGNQTGMGRILCFQCMDELLPSKKEIIFEGNMMHLTNFARIYRARNYEL